jgi:hypothetical protein
LPFAYFSRDAAHEIPDLNRARRRNDRGAVRMWFYPSFAYYKCQIWYYSDLDQDAPCVACCRWALIQGKPN